VRVLGLLASAEPVSCRRALAPQLQLRICCLLQSSRNRGIGWSQADYGAAALLKGLHPRTPPWYRSTCDRSRSPRFGVPQDIQVNNVTAYVTTAACFVKLKITFFAVEKQLK
jgi:hypothetical protein